MLQLLIPDLYVDTVYAIDLKALKERGIRGILLDLDNTLVHWNAPDPPAELRQWLLQVRELGFRACILSNNTEARVQAFAEKVAIPGIHKAIKPRRSAFRRGMELMGTRPHETAVVGDQTFTDVMGGNRLGLYTILVKPLSQREFIGTRLVRRLERAWLAYLRRTGRL